MTQSGDSEINYSKIIEGDSISRSWIINKPTLTTV